MARMVLSESPWQEAPQGVEEAAKEAQKVAVLFCPEIHVVFLLKNLHHLSMDTGHYQTHLGLWSKER